MVRRLEHCELSALEAIDILPSEELTLRENSRSKTVLRIGRLATIRTPTGFDFPFSHPSQGPHFTLAQLGFIARADLPLEHQPARSWLIRRSEWPPEVTVLLCATADISGWPIQL
ncbi:hypothetical protein U8C35_29160 (plasmid) [Sinorhizobium medicae]|uniref:hypothetical protein n=1 Tax=Sinorhizobium medicae TaxID=110321 RepID=UPI002AF6A50F|nr:hypothetical protein [Sinorhizobium medicae]WQO62180.1 hypothetical protein U8C35_29160 [Sinorhizobium medicae]